MQTLGTLITFIRELVVARSFPREPEPALIMDDPEQVAAYARAGRIDGVMSAAYLFHSARISQVLQGCESVLDLGCGPGTQLLQIAGLNPAITFTGVDLSATMLADARSSAQVSGASNVRFEEGDITRLDAFDDHSVDAVISTMALHHMPTPAHLEQCFAAVGRVLRPGGSLYLADFGRLKSLRSVLFFAYMNARHQPHIFSLDYERSLRSAFLKEEFVELAARYLPANAEVVSTFKVPMLVLVKTPDRPLPADTQQRLQEMRRRLPGRYRRDLDTLRLFFRLGGLRHDPFSG